MAAQRARKGRALPKRVARRPGRGRAVASLEAEGPSMNERALVAAEAAEASSRESVDLDDASFVGFDFLSGPRPGPRR
eukprot:4154187-Alexandrium_andersonii.AAC.1